MSVIITGLLNLTLGFLCNKTRDSAANKLRETGDLADEKLRGVIVRDLTDIKSKLDALSEKDLHASYSFLKEGVDLLTANLGKLSEVEKPNDDSSEVATKVENDTASAVLNTAFTLPSEMQSLQVSSDKNYITAQGRFKACRKAATHAFNNTSLSIEDRIMACKLRVAATILESGLESPQVATTACMTALTELHGLAAIKEIFVVFLNGGLKSKFQKAKRLGNIESVLTINHTLYDFACKYSSQLPDLFSWPQIELKDRPFHPLTGAGKNLSISSSLIELNVQLNRAVVIDSSLAENLRDFAVNSRDEIIILDDDKITVINCTGERKVVKYVDKEDSNCFENKGKAIAVGSEDSIYVVSYRETRVKNDDNKKDFVLNVFDTNLNKKHVCVLDFLHASANYDTYLEIAVDKQHNLIMVPDRNNKVYVCDNTGQLKSKFKRDGVRRPVSGRPRLSISNNNDVIIGSRYGKVVHVYSTEGELKTTVTVELPTYHVVFGVAFHHGIGKMIVLSYDIKQWSLFLLSYSEKDEVENSVFLCKDNEGVYMKSHGSGTFVVKTKNIFTLI